MGKMRAMRQMPSYHDQTNVVNMIFLTVQYDEQSEIAVLPARIRGLGWIGGILGSFLSLFVWSPKWPTGSCIYFCVDMFLGSVEKIKDYGQKLKTFFSCGTNAISFPGSSPIRPHKKRGWIRMLI